MREGTGPCGHPRSRLRPARGRRGGGCRPRALSAPTGTPVRWSLQQSCRFNKSGRFNKSSRFNCHRERECVCVSVCERESECVCARAERHASTCHLSQPLGTEDAHSQPPTRSRQDGEVCRPRLLSGSSPSLFMRDQQCSTSGITNSAGLVSCSNSRRIVRAQCTRLDTPVRIYRGTTFIRKRPPLGP